MARADDILPNGSASLGARNHMIEVEFLAGKPPAAILTDTLVPGVNIIPAEADLPLGDPVVTYQQNHPRHADNPVNETYGFVVGGHR